MKEKTQFRSLFKQNSIFLSILLVSLFFLLSGCKSSKNKRNSHNEETLKTEIKWENKRNDAVAKEALEWIGTPYAYGAENKGSATDCSGMVMKIYLDIKNIKLPRNSAKQAEFCNSIKREEVETGDLVFFATGKSKNVISHVGIMIDPFRFVHASASKGVIISEITTPYYERTFIMFGRVPE